MDSNLLLEGKENLVQDVNMNTLNELNTVILDSANIFDNLLTYYGEDKWNFEPDVFSLIIISELIEQACWFKLDDEIVNQLYTVANEIQLNNKMIKFEKPTMNIYKNYNERQTYHTFREL